jgi:hypothetical protein
MIIIGKSTIPILLTTNDYFLYPRVVRSAMKSIKKMLPNMHRPNWSVNRCLAIKCFLNFVFFSVSYKNLLYFIHISLYLVVYFVVNGRISSIGPISTLIDFRASDILVSFFVVNL